MHIDREELRRKSFRAFLLDDPTDYDLLINVLSALIDQEPDNTHLLSNRAVAYHEAGAADAAATDLDRAVALGPKDGVPWALRGRMKAAGGDLEGAVDDFSRAIYAQESAAEYVARARTYRQLGRLEQALDDFVRAVDRGGRVQHELEAMRAQVAELQNRG